MKRTDPNRRSFIKTAGAAAVALPNIITSNALGANGVPPASERIVMAGLGMGGRGRGVLGEFLWSREIQVVAVNDVKKGELRAAQSQVNGRYGNSDCAAYEDYREILARDDIDMVFCAPPDHWHAQMAIDACKAGKDVMCEKPLTLTIGEGRKIVETARRYGRIAAGGSQRVLQDYGKAACAANSGRFGKVLSANASPGGPPWPCYLPGQPVPDDINWDLWLGPAPWAPYHPYRCGRAYGLSGKGFRTWEDYSGGLMTDWGGHKFGAALHGLQLDHTGPTEIHPPKDGKPLTYVFKTGQTLKVQGGPNYVCEGGDVTTGSMRQLKVPEGLRWYSGGATSLVGDFIHCVKTRETPFRDVEWSHRTATICHLGNIALKLNRSLKWDPDNEDFIGDTEASRMVDRPRRGPWQI
ncbi:MAG: Gfo/Idh/MocA family oxidoreductase [Kiritimatiellae bacterium]|nr:Gfo/Idh/MocA family oxidoreductase [Kiritimatiellia bacterium]